MGHGHDHSHGEPGHHHGAGASAARLTGALVVTGSFLLLEVVGAWWFNSLALLSDAGHMFTDTAALAIALAAVKIGQRPADRRRTYGYRRFEVLAAAFNAVLLFIVAGFVLYEGVHRFFAPSPVQSLGMLAVAGAGADGAGWVRSRPRRWRYAIMAMTFLSPSIMSSSSN